MGWYAVGTVNMVSGTDQVTGTSTAWVSNVLVGDALRAPDGRFYEVVDVTSHTALRIKPAYQGPTAAAQAYAIAPVPGRTKTLADRAASMIAAYEGIPESVETLNNLVADGEVDVIPEDTPIPALKTDSGPLEPVNQALRAVGNRTAKQRSDLDSMDPDKGAHLVGNALARVASIAELRALAPPSRKRTIRLDSYWPDRGEGGGTFLWVPASTQADDGGMIIRPDSAPANGRWERGGDRTPEMYGAKGSVVGDLNDDTAAIQAAISKPGVTVRFDPLKNYRIVSLRPANRVSMLGEAGLGGAIFNNGEDSQLGSKLTLITGAGSTAMLDTGGTRGVSLDGMQLDGVDKSAPCITAGFSRLRVRRCRLIRGTFGIGGRGSMGDLYCRTLELQDSFLAGNDIGLSNPIDTFCTKATFASNGHNLYGSAGANTNAFVGCRLEWATTGNNLRVIGSGEASVSTWNFVGCQFDRGFQASVYLSRATKFTFPGCTFQRSNRENSTSFDVDTLVHIRYSSRISFDGATWDRGADDNNGAVQTTTPSYAITLDAGCDQITVCGGGGVAGVEVNFTRFLYFPVSSAPSRVRVTGVAGVPDFSNDPNSMQVDGADVFRTRTGTGNISAGESAILGFYTRTTVTSYTTKSFRLSVSARNTISGAGLAAEFIVLIRREGGDATVTLQEVKTGGVALPPEYAIPVISNPPSQAEVQAIANQLAAITAHLRTPPGIGTSTGTLRLSVSSAAADGSSFNLSVVNAHASQSYAVPRVVLA